MRDYDFKLEAAGAFVLEAQGSRFFYKTGTEAGGRSAIIVSAERGGLELLLLPGEGVRLPQSPGRWLIRKADPINATDIIGRVIVGDADFTASRVQGDVNILNASDLGDKISGGGAVPQRVAGDRIFRKGWRWTGAETDVGYGFWFRNFEARKLFLTELVVVWEGGLLNRPVPPIDKGVSMSVTQRNGGILNGLEQAIFDETPTSPGIYPAVDLAFSANQLEPGWDWSSVGWENNSNALPCTMGSDGGQCRMDWQRMPFVVPRYHTLQIVVGVVPAGKGGSIFLRGVSRADP